ncbi:MAG TPA: VWA domain-containing protein [Candidatus Cloacimonas sp.]|nr:VWA domain-containing protein [Candidatus Cloacimonas sp.]
MNIANPYYLALSGLCLLLLILLFRRERFLQRRFTRYAELHLKEHYYHSQSPFWIGFKLFLCILALGCVIIALARPQWDYENKDLQSSGMDIIFAIDVSQSMDATDMMPSRLLRAILQIGSFLEQVKTDRIGIIAFAGVATLQCPLTDDYEAVRIVLNGCNSNTVEIPGTDIGSALSLAADAFPEGSKSNTLILISDGEDLENSALREAKKLKIKGIRVYTMGVGSPEGTIIRNPETGEEVKSKLDETTLQEIARITEGEYFRVTPGGEEIQLILKRIYENEITRRGKKVTILKEQYYLFAIMAIILLIIECLIDPRKRKKGLMAAEKSNEQ